MTCTFSPERCAHDRREDPSELDPPVVGRGEDPIVGVSSPAAIRIFEASGLGQLPAHRKGDHSAGDSPAGMRSLALPPCPAATLTMRNRHFYGEPT